MISVTGQLVDPLGNGIPNALIRFTAVESVGATPKSAESIYETDSDGNYSFTLEEGTYEVNCNVTDYFEITANIQVDADTPSPINLTDLTRYTADVDTIVILPEDADWEALHDAIRTGVSTTTRSKEDQLTEEDLLVHESKELLYTDSSHMAQETVTVNSGVTLSSSQTNVYEDDNLNQSIQFTESGDTNNASFFFGKELYDASNDKVIVNITSSFTTDKAQYTDTVDLEDDVLDTNKKLTLDSNYTEETSKTSEATVSFSKGAKLTEGEFSCTHENIHASALSHVNDSSALVLKPKSSSIKSTEVYSDLHNAKVTESDYILIDANDEIQAQQERLITTYSKDFYSRYTNNGFLSMIEENPDLYVITDQSGTEVFKIDTVSKEVTINASLTVTNIEDFKGADGDTIFEVYQYSSDNGVFDTWHDEFNIVHGDKWRRHATSTNGVIDTWSEGYNLFAEDGLAGDTLYYEYRYSDDATNWHTVFVDGDIWRSERIIENGSPTSAWSSAARIKGSDGDNGEITEVTYQYSVDGFDPWHSNFSTGDHYRRDRVEYFYTPADRDAGNPYLVTPWSNSAKLVPIVGEDYGTKQSAIYIYQRNSSSTVPPAIPSGDLTWNFDDLTLLPAGNLNGWSASISDAGTGDYLWIGAAVATSTGSEDLIAPAEWDYSLWSSKGANGSNGLTPAIVSLYCVTAAGVTPSKTFSSVTHTIATGNIAIYGSNTYGWSDSIPNNNSAGGQVWVITDVQLAAATSNYTYHYPNYFSNPVVISRNGLDGTDGIDGQQGTHGSGSYVITTSANKSTIQGYSNSTKTSNFTSIAGRAPQNRDILSYVNSSTTSGFRLDYLYNGSSWSAFASVIDGNQIVHGTIASEALVTGIVIADDATINGKIDTEEFTANGGNHAIEFRISNTLSGTNILTMKRSGVKMFYLGSSGSPVFAGGSGSTASLQVSRTGATDVALRVTGKTELSYFTANSVQTSIVGYGSRFMDSLSEHDSVYTYFNNREVYFEKEVQAPLGVNPFTGTHLFLINKNTSVPQGSLVCDGDLISIGNGVSNALFEAHLSSAPRDKSAVGVVSRRKPIENIVEEGMPDNYSRYSASLLAHGVDETWCETNKTNYDTLSVNAVGEGLMLVCSDGGDIGKGDFICSSSTVGHGMKQVDANNNYVSSLEDYTVAKSRINVVWANEPSTTKLIPVFYVAG